MMTEPIEDSPPERHTGPLGAPLRHLTCQPPFKDLRVLQALDSGFGALRIEQPLLNRSPDIGNHLGLDIGGYIFGVGGETYAGVNPETLIQVVAYAKEAGRYPIALAEESR